MLTASVRIPLLDGERGSAIEIFLPNVWTPYAMVEFPWTISSSKTSLTKLSQEFEGRAISLPMDIEVNVWRGSPGHPKCTILKASRQTARPGVKYNGAA